MKKTNNPNEKIIIALDGMDKQKVLNLIENIIDAVKNVEKHKFLVLLCFF